MVFDRRLIPLEPAATTGRSPAGSAAPLFRRAALAAEKRRPMARFTKIFTIRVNFTKAIDRVDDLGTPHRGLGEARRSRRRTGTNRLEATHRRWHVLPGKKGGELVADGKKGKGTTALVLMDNEQTPLAVVITGANEHESRHIERLIDAAVVPLPNDVTLIYDKAADSDPLRERLASCGIKLVAPPRRNRRRQLHHEHKKRLRQRWKIERTNAWLHRYGRLAIRKDRRADIFLGWNQLACLFTILKRF